MNCTTNGCLYDYRCTKTECHCEGRQARGNLLVQSLIYESAETDGKIPNRAYYHPSKDVVIFTFKQQFIKRNTSVYSSIKLLCIFCTTIL